MADQNPPNGNRPDPLGILGNGSDSGRPDPLGILSKKESDEWLPPGLPVGEKLTRPQAPFAEAPSPSSESPSSVSPSTSVGVVGQSVAPDGQKAPRTEEAVSKPPAEQPEWTPPAPSGKYTMPTEAEADAAAAALTEEQRKKERQALAERISAFDVRQRSSAIPTTKAISSEDVLAGYKQSSISPDVLENSSIWDQLGLIPMSDEERSKTQYEVNAVQPYQFAATKIDGLPQRGILLSDSERQSKIKKLEIDDAIRNGRPTLALDDNPMASLVHHNRVIAKKANEYYDGNVSRYMDITESRNIIPNYLRESDQQEYKILSDIRNMENVWKAQINAGNKDIAAETLRSIEKKKDEYTKLASQKQIEINNEIQALSKSDDPDAKRKIEVLRAQNQLFLMTDEQREKFALEKTVPNVDQLRSTVFKGMSDRDILRLALHTKYLQLQQLIPDNAVAKGFDIMRMTDVFSEDVRKLKQEIAILAPVVFLNSTPIKKIDEGFFSTAGKAFAAGFGGEGTERARASTLSGILQEYDVMGGVAPEAIKGIESAQATKQWSAEEAGELVGSSGEFMVKLIPTALLTEAGLGQVGLTAQAERGVELLKLIGRISNSRKALYAGRALEGTYEAIKQGLSYELGGRLYDQRDQMNFLSGAFGGLGGYVAGGAAEKLASGLETRILAAFGSASDDVASKMIELGKKAAASGVRSIGQGVGETAEEFGEALGGIINQSDSAAEMMKNLKEQFPDASSTFHFAAQSFLMGAIMGQSSAIGSALYKRANNYYSQLGREEKNKFDTLAREVNDVGEGVKEEMAKPEEKIASIEGRLNKVQTRIAEIESGNRIVGKEGVALNFPDELESLKEEESELIKKREQLKKQTDAVQERTAAQMGAQPLGAEGAGQEGGEGVGPRVQGPEAPQASRAEGQVIQERTDSKGRVTKVSPVKTKSKDGSVDITTFSVSREGREITGSGLSFNSIDEFVKANPGLDQDSIDSLADNSDFGIREIILREHRYDSKTGVTGLTVAIITNNGIIDAELKSSGAFSATAITPTASTPTAEGPVSPEAPTTPAPTEKQILDDIRNGRIATFTYDSVDEVPDAFKDRITSTGETQQGRGGEGKKQVRVSMSQSEADYFLQRAAPAATGPVSPEAPPAPASERKAKTPKNGIGSVEFNITGVSIEGFDIDGNFYNVLTSIGRPKVIVNINGISVPFYLTSGQGGKNLTPGWYPFAGIGNDGWLNKTGKSDMESYYERLVGSENADLFRQIAQGLNEAYGTDASAYKPDADPTTSERPLSSMSDKTDDYINSRLPFKPVSNNTSNTRTGFESNMRQLSNAITNAKNAKVAAPSATTAAAAAPAPTTAPAPTITVAEPKAETVALFQRLADLRDKLEMTTHKGTKTRRQNEINKLLAENPQLAEADAKFDEAVKQLEDAKKLKVRCP